jgi:hypothetical protein
MIRRNFYLAGAATTVLVADAWPVRRPDPKAEKSLR